MTMPDAEEYDAGLAEKRLQREENEAMVALFTGGEGHIDTVPMYREVVAALKKKRAEEQARIISHERDPSFVYRWCDPKSERFPYLVVRGWVPVMEGQQADPVSQGQVEVLWGRGGN
jgi:hypothetical protein